MLNPKIISENITFLRQQQGMTQQELADRVNVTHQAVSKWENGSSIPDLQTLMTLSRLFNVTLDELLTEVLAERRAASPEVDTSATDQPADEEPASQPNAEPSENGDPHVNIKALARTAPFMERDALKEAVLNIDPADFDTHAIVSLVPFLDRATLSALVDRLCAGSIDMRQITSLAPFLDRTTLAKLVDRLCDSSIDMRQITSLAPFLDRTTLGKLVNRASEEPLDLSQITPLAPFLDRADVDKLIDRMASGQIDIHSLVSLAPFASHDKLSALAERACPDDPSALTALAPFLDRADVDKLADRAFAAEPTVRTVTALAPFLSREKLTSLVSQLGELSMNDLIKLAPFLARSAMSSLLQKLVPGHFQVTVNNARSDAPRHVHFSVNGVDVTNIGNEDDDEESGSVREAIDNQDWDYIEHHISDMTPDEQREAALSAAEEGYLDFIAALALDQETLNQVATLGAENADVDDLFELLPWAQLSPEAQSTVIDAVLDRGDGDELLEHSNTLTADQLEHIALHFAENGDFDELADVFFNLPDKTRAAILAMAIDADDLDFLRGHFNRLDPADCEKIALHMAKSGDFDELQPLLPHLSGDTLSRVVGMAIDADDLDLIASSVHRLSPADQEKIAVHWAEEEEWSELTRHVDLTKLSKDVLRRLIDLAEEQEERSVACRLHALLDAAPASGNGGVLSAAELLNRAHTGDFAPLSGTLPALNDEEWDELVRLAIIFDAFDALAPHAALIPPQPFETLCCSLARLGDTEHLSVFFPHPSDNPELAQRLNRIADDSDH